MRKYSLSVTCWGRAKAAIYDRLVLRVRTALPRESRCDCPCCSSECRRCGSASSGGCHTRDVRPATFCRSDSTLAILGRASRTILKPTDRHEVKTRSSPNNTFQYLSVQLKLHLVNIFQQHSFYSELNSSIFFPPGQ